MRRLSFDLHYCLFGAFRLFKHTHISTGRQHRDEFKAFAATTLVYIDYSFHPLLLRISRMPPATS